VWRRRRISWRKINNAARSKPFHCGRREQGPTKEKFRVGPEGTHHMANSGEQQTNTNTSGVQNGGTVTVLSNGNYVVAWQDTTLHQNRARLYSSTGTPITNGTTSNTNDFAISESTAALSSDSNDLSLNAINAGPNAGGFLETYVLQNAATGDEFVEGRIYNSTGTLVGSPFQISTVDVANNAALEVTRSSAAVFSDGSFLVVWEQIAPSGTSSIIEAQRFDASGTPLSSTGAANGGTLANFQISTTQTGIQEYPDITILNNGNYVVTWDTTASSDSTSGEITYRVFNSAGTSLTSGQVNQTTANAQTLPSVTALAGGGFAISWTSFDEVSGSSAGDVYVRIYNSSGAATTNEILVDTNATGTGVDPNSGVQDTSNITALPDGGFLVMYNGEDTGGSAGVFAQRFDSAGNRIGLEFEVNQTTAGSQTIHTPADHDPDVSQKFTSGVNTQGIVAAWDGQGDGSTDPTTGIYTRAFEIHSAPTDANVTDTTAEDTPYTFTNADFSTNFADSPFDTPADTLQAIEITTLPANGTIRLNGAAVSAGQVVAISEINAGHLTYTPPLNANRIGATPYTTFTYQAQDSGGTATGSVNLSAAYTFSLFVTPVNDAPVVSGTTQSLTAINEDSTNPSGQTVNALFSGHFDDSADNQLPNGSSANNFIGVAVRGNAATAAQGVWQYSTDSGTNWTSISTTVSDASALELDTSALLRFVPATNFNGPAPTLSVRLIEDSNGTSVTTGNTINVSTNGGATSFSAGTIAASETITAVNDAPLVVNGSTAALTAINEDATPSGTLISSIYTSHFDDSADNQTANGGSSANTLAGIAITANAATAAQGTWQWSTNGTTWNNIATTVSDTSALVLAATTQLRFLPAANYNGTAPDLTSHLIDNSSGAVTNNSTVNLTTTGTGGTTQYSTGTVALAETINAVNDNPNLQPDSTSAVSYTENAGPTALFATETVDSPLPDVDNSANYAGGSIDLNITLGAVTGDRLSLTGSRFVIDASNNVEDTANANAVVGNIGATNGTSHVTISSLTTAATPAVVDALIESFGFDSTSEDPGNGDRTVTLTFNDGGNTGSGVALTDSVTQIVHVTPVNDPPTLSATTTAATYTEDAAAVGLFSGANASTVEAGQRIQSVTLTVSNVTDTNEILNIDGSDIALTNGANLTTGGPNFVAVNVATSGTTATVTLSNPAGWSAAATDGILNGITYRDSSQNPVGGTRTITITSLMDNGGGADTTNPNIASTVNVVPVNDAPTFTGTQGAGFTEGGSPAQIATSVSASDVDSSNYNGGSLNAALTGTQTGDSIALADAGGISVSGSTVSCDPGTGAVAIGTITTNTATSITVSLNTNATDAAVQALTQAFTFSNSTQDPTNNARTVTFTLVDGGGQLNSGQDTTSFFVSVPVTGINNAPTVTPPGSAYLGTPGSAVTLTGISFADADAESGQETVTFDVGSGTLSTDVSTGVTFGGTGPTDLTATGTLTNLNNFISDGHLHFTGSSSTTLTINMTDNGNTPSPAQTATPRNVGITLDQPPNAAGTSGLGDEDNGRIAITLTGTDPDVGDAVERFNISLQPGHGQVFAASSGGAALANTDAIPATSNGAGGYTATVYYQPDADYNGSDTFQYTAFDGDVSGSAATASITVNAVADIANDTATTNEDTAVNILVQGNDTFENPAHSISAVGTPSNGTATINDNGTAADTTDDYIVYTPNADFNGSDSFTYTVSSGGGAAETATVNVTVNPVADIANDTATTNEDTAVDIPVQSNDTFSSPTHAITGTTAPSHGTVAINTHGTADTTDDSIIYTPNTNYNGPDSFTYTVSSGGSADETATVNVTVNAVNDAPVLSGLGDTPAFVENGASVVLDTNSNASVSDAELDASANHYAGTTLTLARNSGANPDDVFGSVGSLDLTNVNGNGENVSLDGGATFIGTYTQPGDGSVSFTFNANATAADVDSVMRQLTYQNTSDNPPASAQIDFSFSDGNGQPGGQAQGSGPTPGVATGSITVAITQVDDPPQLINVAPTAAYAPGSAGAVLSPALGVFDPDATAPSPVQGIHSGTVQIANGLFAGDELFVNLPSSGGHFVTQDGVTTNISASYAAGTLTLSGTDTVPDYQSVLDAVSYRSTAADPSNGGTDPNRTITWSVNDGVLNSQTPGPDVNETMLHFDTAPTVDLDGSSPGTGYTTTYTTSTPAIPIVNNDLVTDPDTANADSMTIVLTNAMAGDALSIAGSLPGGIASSIDTSVAGRVTLRLFNSASLGDYQTALSQVRFANSSVSPNTTDRDITVVLSESDVDSNTAHATVHVVDATPPAKPPAPDLTDASDSGVSHTDNITNVAASTFTGTVEPGTTVRLYDSDGTTVVGTTLADAQTGAYTVTSSALSQGTHHLTVTATDASNNTSVHSDALDVTIDTTAPAPTLTAADPTTTVRNSTVHYTLSYPELTFGVDAGDFTLTTTGTVAGAAITGLTEPGGPGTPYVISVSTGTGLGTIEVDLRSSGTGISDTAGNLSGGATGPVYTVADRAPVAHNEVVTLSAAQATLTGNVLSNDTDADGDTLRVTSVYDYLNGVQHQVAVPASGSAQLQSNHGVFTISADGSYSFTANDSRPAQGHYAEDPLVYTISDGFGGTASAQLDVNLAAQPRPSTETFNFNFVNAAVNYGSDGQSYLTGPDGVTHNVTGVNLLVFNDGRINEADYNQSFGNGGPPPGRPGGALVDDLYYDSQYHDVYMAGIDPEQHYAQYGWHEGRNPDPYFNTNYYLSQNPDVAAAGINPLNHYDQYGWREGRNPSANFDTRDYELAYPDVAAAGIDPLGHYLQYGELENRLTFPVNAGTAGPIDGFDPNYYLTNNPDVAAAGINPFQHYLQYGWHEGRNPSAYFNTDFYESHNPDVAAAGIDPLIHYDQYGWHEGRDPSAAFSTQSYLTTYPDVMASGENPLQQFLEAGMAQGRNPKP
jgi:hypothetical protein